MKKVIFYPTYRSNDFCEYSRFWKSAYYTEILEGETGVLIKALADVYGEGARHIEIRGGEPLLREDLPQILSGVRSQFHISLRTNGLLLEERAQSYMGLVHHFSLLLYHPEREVHDRILGVEGFGALRKAAHALKKVGMPGDILYIVTRETITHLPEALDFAAELGLPLHMEPFYLSVEVTAFEKGSLESIAYMGRKGGIVYTEGIQKILKADTRYINRSFCTAGESPITVGPDGKRIHPCVHAEGKDGKPGTLPPCAFCTDWSYLLPGSDKIVATK